MNDLIYSCGSLRLKKAEETLAWVVPKFSDIGISRIAEVTGLDFIGIPTWQAIRPKGLTLCVSHGKGCTNLQAQVSAIMEATEFACWENYCPLPNWKAHHNFFDEKAISLEEFADSIFYPIKEDVVQPWTKVIEISSNDIYWIGYDLMSMKRNSKNEKIKWAYTSTNGLASGNSIKEALLHAILELIERDSECCASFLMLNDKIPRIHIDSYSIDENYLSNLIDKIRVNSCSVEIFQNPNEFGIYSFSVYIVDKSNLLYSNIGHGAHFYSYIALSRAITEAAQGRITMISGSREDNFRCDYRYIKDVAKNINERCDYELSISKTKKINFKPELIETSLDIAMDNIISRIKNNGFNKILFADLTDEKIQVPVVKVLIPGLCGYHRPLKKRIQQYRDCRLN